jgi:KAP family P-loop domain
MTINRALRLDQIWAGDKLERRQLAEQVEGYIKARFEQPAPGSGSFTFAVEGSYGLGKSYFLERLRQQLSLNHPVAFVNAWTDDTANDPLTSIFLAVEDALAEKLVSSNEAERKKIAEKLKGVAKIAAKVALRGAGSVLLTAKGYEELESAFETGVDDLFGLRTEKSTDTALVSKRKLISDFQVKLAELLDSLEADGLFVRPLIIIVDELDRCRPTYAISLLEEAKHFFDDTGTIFVYGMNRKALAATVKSIYGDEFPADHYLMRFVKRQISLPASSLHDLINEQWDRNAHLTSKLWFPNTDGENNAEGAVPWLATLFGLNHILARDAEYVMELIFSFAAMWDKKTFIHLPYLACLAVNDYKSQRGADGDSQVSKTPFVASYFLGQNDDSSDMMMRYGQIASWDINTLHEQMQRAPNFGICRFAMKEIELEFAENGRFPDVDVSVLRSFVGTYAERLKTVGKFVVIPEFEHSETDLDSEA